MENFTGEFFYFLHSFHSLFSLNWFNFTLKERNTFQKEVQDELVKFVTDVDKTNILTQQYFIPFGFNDESQELYNELMKVNYQYESYEGNELVGNVIWFPDLREMPEGTYHIEAGLPSFSGYYLHSTVNLGGTLPPKDHYTYHIWQHPAGTTCAMEYPEETDNCAGEFCIPGPNPKPHMVCNKETEKYQMGRLVTLYETDLQRSDIEIRNYAEDPKFKWGS